MASEPKKLTDAEIEEAFSDEAIAEELKPFFAEIDADYEAAFEPLLKAFEAKGSPAEKDYDP